MPSIRSHLLKVLLKREIRKTSHLPFSQCRTLMDRQVRLFKNASGVSQSAVKVGERDAQWLVPERAVADAAVLYLHGGAYVSGSLRSHRALASHIARASQVRVLLLDYRLAPEHPFPAALDDAVAAFAWLQSELGLQPDRIVIAGDSAGGGLSLATALRIRNSGQPLPRALVALSPWTDLTCSGKSFERLSHKDPFFPTADRLQQAALAYARQIPLNHPEVSPRFADLRGLPDLYIQVGSDEVLLSDSVDLANQATKVGVKVRLEEWPGMWHVWQAFCDWMPESRDAISRIGQYINAALRRDAS
ncbi:alpha/beta hydrolase [Pseudomonas sp. PDM15]|uniref:alpha/beta hydrolase n=1 Tax=Pseudomonas sp. PDM15 TaxID=2769303 RepID=UPI001784255B|nr:alpha/beta hydrolase [Pseudomonas sp. PDM15]MBD9427818.1 alpha/beta hydrolase [Pseudomonas sp. PDM15]